MHWFTKYWWKNYLLVRPANGISLWTAFWCRARGHKCGVIWYTCCPDSMEPDMHCKNCYDDLG